MFQLLSELKKCKELGRFDDAKIELEDMQIIPASRQVLRQPSIRALYTPICGALVPSHARTSREQDRTHVSLVTCHALEEKVLQFVDHTMWC